MGRRHRKDGEPRAVSAFMPKETQSDKTSMSEFEMDFADHESVALKRILEERKKGRKKRTRLKWSMRSGPEKTWAVINGLTLCIDIAASALFCYMGFIHYQGDDIMDPLAWQLAFGAAAIMILLKDSMIALGGHDFFSVWLSITALLSVGHIYGAVRYFLWLQDQEFNCFIGDEKIRKDVAQERFLDTGICYNGELLLCTSFTACYLSGSCLFMWKWQHFTKTNLLRKGEMEKNLDVFELLKSIDDAELKDDTLSIPREASQRIAEAKNEEERMPLSPGASTSKAAFN